MEIYVTQFLIFLMLFVRIIALIVVAPMMGHQTVPVTVKVALGLFVAFVMFPLVSATPIKVDTSLVGLFIATVTESMVGLIIGFVTGLLFAAARFAGEIISYEIGISMANVFDPETNQTNPIVGEFLYLIMVLVFLLINGHHFVFESLIYSYKIIPIGGLMFHGPLLDTMLNLTGMVFILAVKIAAPVMVASFLTNVALSVVSRVVPQMNILMTSFPLKIGVGYIMIAAAAPLIVVVMKKSLQGFESNILELIKVL
jgi:flagellar biosynthesis protein FliR